MLKQVKEVIYTVGDTTGSFAKSVGLTTSDFAKSIGKRSSDLVDDIGPRRILIGAALLAVAVGGGIVLVRYLRRREQAELDQESMEASDAAVGNRGSLGRAENRAINRANAAMR
jgi:hypothetical protein